ncbi:MAG: hypothetical protein V1798_10380 [Pseudomonadota bacterium]
MKKHCGLVAFLLAVTIALTPAVPVSVPEARAVTGIDDAAVGMGFALVIAGGATISTAVLTISYMQRGIPADRAMQYAFNDVSRRTWEVMKGAGVRATEIQQGLALVTTAAVAAAVQRIQTNVGRLHSRPAPAMSPEVAAAVATANIELTRLYTQYGLTAQIEASREAKDAWIRNVVSDTAFGAALSSTLSRLTLALQLSISGEFSKRAERVREIRENLKTCRERDPKKFRQLAVGSLGAVLICSDVIVAFLNHQLKGKEPAGAIKSRIIPEAFIALLPIRNYLQPFLNCALGQETYAEQLAAARNAGPPSMMWPYFLVFGFGGFLVLDTYVLFAKTPAKR